MAHAIEELNIISPVEWIPTMPEELSSFANRAVVGGEEGKSPVWVIRATLYGDVVPGKLVVNSHEASVPWGGKAHVVNEIQVAVADEKNIQWLPGSDGSVPSSAIVAGFIRSTGEALYVGRAEYLGQTIPGKIEPSQKVLYIPYEGSAVKIKDYEVLCKV